MEWMLMPLKRYADFSGRPPRMEYWMYVLGLTIVFLVVGLMFGVMLGGMAASSAAAGGPDKYGPDPMAGDRVGFGELPPAA